MNYIEIAKQVLEKHSIKSKSIVLIGQNYTSVYKVTDDNKNMIYCLRLHISKDNMLNDNNEKIKINSELEWISAIAADTDIIVPTPYKNIYGEYVTEINGVNCSLLKWIDGESRFNEDTCKQLIEVMAKLHKHASNWVIPEGFVRPSYDFKDVPTIFSHMNNIDIGTNSKDSFMILKEAYQKAINIIVSIEKNNKNWGLIHRDLIPQNILFHNDKICPIDFGACGFGFYLFDICYTFVCIPAWYREFFLNEYIKYFSLPDNYIQLAEALYITAHTPQDENGLRDALQWIPDYINNLASREASLFLNDKSFLFETAFFM